MRPALFLIFLICASAALVPPAAATQSCEPRMRAHPTGVVIECRVAKTGLVVIVGWHQDAQCETNDGNVIVIIGDDNTVDCPRNILATAEGEECPPVAVAVTGSASSCGITIVVFGEGEGRIVIVGWGKAQGGVIALVLDGCASQNEEGAAYGVFTNGCGRSILSQANTPAVPAS